MRIDMSTGHEMAGVHSDLYTARVTLDLGNLDWNEFLTCRPLPRPSREILETIGDVPVLVIGAGGSIGSALAFQLATLKPPALVLLDSSEGHLEALQRTWAREGPAYAPVLRLGSVGDGALLREIFAAYRPRLVFHAGAFKHVCLLEEQPLAAIENNILGTQRLMDAAAGARVLLLSTDKAVQPTSVMGATKRVAEQIVLSEGGMALRLGNVLGSSGSVVEIFARQIENGEALTITDSAANRYFLTIDEATNLLLAAALEPCSPALFAPAMPAPQSIVELACFMSRKLAPGREISQRFTGLRSGDKLAEQFWGANEMLTPAMTPGLLSIESPLPDPGALQRHVERLRASLDRRDVASAIDSLRILVPEYVPTSVLMALVRQSSAEVRA